MAGIAAKDLGTRKIIEVTDPRGGKLAFTVSPADYMGLAVKNGSQALLNRAFYNYYQKAAAYYAQQSGNQQPGNLMGGNANI